MNVEEWSLEWDLFAAHKVIDLKDSCNKWPVSFALYRKSGELVFERDFYSNPLYIPIEQIAVGDYHYQIIHREQIIQQGSFKL